MRVLNANPSLYNKHPKNTSNLKVGQALLARFSQDNFWYRVKVLSINSLKDVKVNNRSNH
jgi:Tudor domain.